MIETLCNVSLTKRPKLRICEVHNHADADHTIVTYQDRSGVWSNRHGHSRVTVTIPDAQVFGIHGDNPYLTEGERSAMYNEMTAGVAPVAFVRSCLRRRYGVSDTYLDGVMDAYRPTEQMLVEWC